MLFSHKTRSVPRKVSIAVSGGNVNVTLLSRSPLLAACFSENWKETSDDPVWSAVLVDLIKIGSKPKVVRLSRSLWFGFGLRDYSSLKLGIRGMMSCSDIKDTFFAHACSFALGGDEPSGYLVLGSSGAGKSTLISNLLADGELEVRMVNDDWGPVSMATGEILSTGERRLHMKTSSARALGGKRAIGHFRHVERGRDEHDRGLIEKGWVYPEFIESARLKCIVLMTRSDEMSAGISSLSVDEAMRSIERGCYSKYYGMRERFCDGSLSEVVGMNERRYRSRLRRVLSMAERLYLLNSTGEIPETYSAFKSIL